MAPSSQNNGNGRRISAVHIIQALIIAGLVALFAMGRASLAETIDRSRENCTKIAVLEEHLGGVESLLIELRAARKDDAVRLRQIELLLTEVKNELREAIRHDP